MDPLAEHLVALALRVAKEAESHKIKTAIIGAAALAHHNYPRATYDIDLGACTDFNSRLRRLAQNLEQQGLNVTLISPDDDDPLDGVLQVRLSEGSEEKVEIVNFRGKIGLPVVERAQDGFDGLRYVRLPELIALKFYAGGPKSVADIHEVLSANPSADIEEIRKVCTELGFEAEINALLADRE